MNFLSRLFHRAAPALLEARPRDAAALAVIHARSFRHGWSEAEFERLLSERTTLGHVARADGGRGAAIAFILSRIVQDEAEILTVAVVSAERGRGLARRLLDTHLSRLAALDVREVFLEVDEGNVSALRLYRRAGFREVGRRDGYYRKPSENATALVLGRALR
ncbi:MAG TPA: ribosomal protein S18-alanine N-acetyltransferase [Xanthobacteraceae bacterium]|nr:ribosomal protein S18-alanine N-acetyltransferase [Xanthobacteraceae bacterium]